MSRTIRIVGAAMVMMAMAACSPGASVTSAPVPAATPGEEAAVLAAADAFMRAITAGDRAAMAAIQLSDGMSHTASAGADGAWTVRGRPLAWFSDPARPASPPMRERYWTPTVLVRHAIAVVWAPYEFWVNGATSHCGVDMFAFAKVDGQWRLANAMWTVEPAACAELRPTDAAAIRPRD